MRYLSHIITVRHKGDFAKTRAILRKCLSPIDAIKLREYGEKGVKALKAATPVDSGKTRDSWWYNVEISRHYATLTWFNDNYAGDGKRYTVPVAVLIDNGHATKDGKWIPGKHFIEPVLNPIIDECINDVWEGMTK